MKRIITIFTLLSYVININSQELKLKDFYDFYDQIFKTENTYLSTGRSYLFYCEKNKKNTLKCSSQFGMKRLIYLEKKLKDSLFNVRRVACELIYNVGVNSDDIKVRQRAVEDILDMFFLGAYHICSQYLFNFNIEDFSYKSKKRIKEIIKGKRNQFEIAEHIKKYYIWNITQKSFFEQVNYIAKTDSLDYNVVLEKEKEKEKILAVQSAKNGFEISTDLFLLTGWLYMYDFIPELQSMLITDIYKPYSSYIKIALARMGNKVYEDEILTYTDLHDLYLFFYINTKSSIKLLVDRYLNVDQVCCCDGDCDIKIPLSWRTYYLIQERILNLPNIYYLNIDPCYSDEEMEKIQKGIKWINKNINNLELSAQFK